MTSIRFTPISRHLHKVSARPRLCISVRCRSLPLKTPYSRMSSALAPRSQSLPETMKQAIVQPDLTTKITTTPLPSLSPTQLLIQTLVAGTNPKDWKRPLLQKRAHNSGDDIAGIVSAVGKDVQDFKVGDRVAGFHEMGEEWGAFGEFGVVGEGCAFKIPERMEMEEAATIPLAAMTAAVGLYRELKLPSPWSPTMDPLPLVIYGGSSAVGAFAIKFARASNIHPLIVVAGKASDYVEKLIDRTKGDTIIDYRKGSDHIVRGIKQALQDAGVKEVNYAFDAISEHGSQANICNILGSTGKTTYVLPQKSITYPPHVTHTWTQCGISFQSNKHGKFAWPKPDSPEEKAGIVTGGSDFAAAYYKLIERGLRQGWFTPHPYEIVQGGLDGVTEALKRLKDGEASGRKFVLRIGEGR